jgi:MerR family transcriptional regulator/heat shock protein HspR
VARKKASGDGGDRMDRRRGVYMISVAAELAGMHPQTLRIYETRGLITPKRSSGNTRLYSQEDVDRLERMTERLHRLQREAERMERQMLEEIERVRRSFRFELVPYEPPEQALVPTSQKGVQIPIKKVSSP